MRFQVRAMMIVVAVAGLVLSLVVHVRAVAREYDDFTAAILFGEGVAVAVLLTVAFGIGFFVRLLRKDDAYASRLRRDDVPARCPVTTAEADSPRQG